MDNPQIPNQLLPGTLLKGSKFSYEVVKVLGEGSFGITYLAKLKLEAGLGTIDGNAMVAIKEFFMHDINGRDASASVTNASADGIYDHYKKKFIREAYALSRVKHPFVVNVLEYFEANNTVYYTMELLPGGSLDDKVVEQNGLTEDQVLMYTAQLSAALSHMHACMMIHLDLKPSNVMLRQDGTIALIDFGLSKQYDPNGNPESSTSVSGGTPGYSPLEQMSYNSNIDKGLPVTMDIYALGATMYKMITAQLPPLASDILNEGFPTQMLEDRGTRQEIIAIIQKAMAPLKKNRYQSIWEMYQALLPLLPPQYQQKVLTPDTKIDTGSPKNEPIPNTSAANAPKPAPVADGGTVVIKNEATAAQQPAPQPVRPQPAPEPTVPAQPQPVKPQPAPQPVRPQPAPEPTKPAAQPKPAPQPTQPIQPKPQPKPAPAPADDANKGKGGKKNLILGIVGAVVLIGAAVAFLIPKGEKEVDEQAPAVTEQVQEGQEQQTPEEATQAEAPATESPAAEPAAEAPAQPAQSAQPTQPAQTSQPAQPAQPTQPAVASGAVFGGAATYDKASKTITFNRAYTLSKGDGSSISIPAGAVIKNAFVSGSGEFRSGQLIISGEEPQTLMGYSVKI